MPGGKSAKEEIRGRARLVRCNLTPQEAAAHSRAICESVLDELNGEHLVLIYASKELEVSTGPLIERLISEGVRVVVPIIERETRTLRLSYLDDLSVLVKSTFSVPEPIGNEIPARGEDIKTIVVPMLAFDRAGHRLGYGAGYYDRFLSLNRDMKKIGVAFSCQEVSFVPSDENDISMDIIVTENEVIRCRSGGMVY
jgi:5-formyltetrahydrofolate cyclo-ligase